MLSRVVNAAIATPGLYDVMKLLARQTLISTVRGMRCSPWRGVSCAALRRVAWQAEKNGIPWREEVKRFETDPRFQARASRRRITTASARAELVRWQQAEAARLTDARVTYPEYYLKPFHAYSEGNLNWLAAFEAESATYSMALRVWYALRRGCIVRCALLCVAHACLCSARRAGLPR